jgi:hypothetical protein
MVVRDVRVRKMTYRSFLLINQPHTWYLYNSVLYQVLYDEEELVHYVQMWLMDDGKTVTTKFKHLRFCGAAYFCVTCVTCVTCVHVCFQVQER